MGKKSLIYRAAAVAVILLIAVAMFIIGRGHTIYFDNKSFENDGKTIDTPYKIEVLVNGEKVASLKDGERGMVDTMGQDFKMQLVITEEKGGSSSKVQVKLPIPYNMDGVIINLPAMLEGLDQKAYMTEFIPIPASEDTDDEEVVTDDMDLQMDFGEQ